MATLKSLGKDSVVYGLSNVVGRFINYFLVPIQTYSMAAGSGEYGIITNMYAWTGFILLLLVCGMETTFQKFANMEQRYKPADVYANALIIVGAMCVAFVALVFGGIGWIAPAMGYEAHPEYLLCMAAVVAVDALVVVPFVRLRFERKTMTFALYKLLNIFLSVGLNFIFFIVLPWLARRFPDSVGTVYAADNVSAAVAFYINAACSFLVALLMLPYFKLHGGKYNKPLMGEMLKYTFPMLLIGVGGQMTQSFDKMFFKQMYTLADADVQLGIYGACAKIAAFVMIVTTAYRYALEPLVFGNGKYGDKKNPKFLMSSTMAFMVLMLTGILGILAWMDVLRYFINRGYWEALDVVWILMVGELFFAIFFNFSFWYKDDEANPYWGALFSFIGLAILAVVNIVYVPRYGYHACAWAIFVSWGIVMVLSFIVGRMKGHLREFSVPRMLAYAGGAALALVAILNIPATWSSAVRIALGTVVTLIYGGITLHHERLLHPLLAKFLHRRKQ